MFENAGTKLLAALAAVGLLVASFLFGYGVGRTSPPTATDDYSIVREAEKRVRESAVKEADHHSLIQGAVRGLIESLGDPYSEYLDPKTYKSFQDLTSGHFTGVGLLLKSEEDDRIKVVSVLNDTPASKAGMSAGDFITSVDGKSVAGLSLEQVAQRIKGEVGTTVTVTVMRGDQALDFKLTRAEISVPNVESQLLKNRVGLIQVVTFSTGVGEKVRESVKSLSARGAKAFILDLRGNPGGLVNEAVELSSVFLDGGVVVSYRERGKAEVTYTARGELGTKLPLVLLVDEGSASASEIVAGAMQDRGRGIVVGTETYGKGSIQGVFALSDGSAIKLTTAHYFTPSGRSIGEKGITPDVAVTDKEQQLARAQEILSEMLADNPNERAG